MRFWSIIGLVIIFSACTVTKRQFRPGFHFEWRTQLREANLKSEKDSLSNDEQSNYEFNKTANGSEVSLEIPSDISTAESDKDQFVTKNETSGNHSFLFGKLPTIKDASNHIKANILNKKNKAVPLVRKNEGPYMMLKTPEEYLISALWAFLIGAVLVGIGLIFVIVLEVDGLSVGGFLVYLICIIGGGACLIAVPILLLLALVSFLFG